MAIVGPASLAAAVKFGVGVPVTVSVVPLLVATVKVPLLAAAAAPAMVKVVPTGMLAKEPAVAAVMVFGLTKVRSVKPAPVGLVGKPVVAVRRGWTAVSRVVG